MAADVLRAAIQLTIKTSCFMDAVDLILMSVVQRAGRII